jgi:Beta-galactosidase
MVAVTLLGQTIVGGCSSGQQPRILPPPSTTPAGQIASPPTVSATTPASGGTNTITRCPVTAPPATAMSAPPEGLVAFSIYQPGRDPFPGDVFTDASVSGVALFVQWSHLEPESGQFDWSILDCVFEQADAHSKFVTLALSPGFTTPSWVFALPGVESQTFTFSYNNNAPARPLPLPWNQPYLDAWFTFLKAVAGRYAANPEFRQIAVGGPTSVSTEMSLPDRTSGDTSLPPSTKGSDVAEWMNLGYTPSKYVAAWKEAFAEYHQLFPRQYLGLALYPGLPIGENGQADPAQANATRLEVIAVGLQYKRVFDLMEDGISGGVRPPSDPAYNAVMANCGNIVTGLQNAKSATASPDEQGPPENALVHVVAAGVRFWEVYTSDVLNPAMQSAMAKAAAELPADKGCEPLVLSTGSRTATSETVTAATDLRLDPAEALNIFKGTTLLRTCSTSTCSVQVPLESGRTVYTADVGEPGTVPYSNQAVVSATASDSPP